ncbi:MAG: hypothetical protein ACR2N0_18860 [Rubrobacteraceae bacterium]
MNLETLYGNSFIGWEDAAESWQKRTVAASVEEAAEAVFREGN